MRNMLIVPTEEELKKDFNDGVDFHIFNAGEFQVIFHIEITKINKSTLYMITEIFFITI